MRTVLAAGPSPSIRSSLKSSIAGYKISYGTKSLIIPQDTIVSANSNIKIPLQISNQDKVSLSYPNGSDISVILSESEKNSKLAEIESQIDIIKKIIADIDKKENIAQIAQNQNLPKVTQTENEEDVRIADAIRDESVKIEDIEPLVSTSTISFPKEENKSFLDALLSTPKMIFEFIKW